ncbi:hypothetical protein ACFL6T_04705 [Candidatus Zixiibacteriota bacterium]
MGMDTPIVILDGGRRTPRADILVNNSSPGLFSRFSTTQLGGMAVASTLEHTAVDSSLIGHVVMGMAQHTHRDSIYAAQGMRWRGGLGDDVPALTVARICGSGAEAIAVGSEMMLAGVRHDRERPFTVAVRACRARSLSIIIVAVLWGPPFRNMVPSTFISSRQEVIYRTRS